MNGYKLYMMERGHIRAAHDLTASSDEEAIRLADELRQGDPAELWRRDKMIAVFNPASERFG